MTTTSSEPVPYLSVVVATRNDDHGGDPLKRLQALVNTFDEQCRRTGLDAEVIVVEWNPPEGKPRVSSLLRMPPSPACTYRFVEVPAALHAKLQAADVLPLFQMIAKNVGIRRARAPFVLATNIDIILSNALVEWIASRPLRPGQIYRVDRHDIEPNVPVDGPLETQMAYAASHQLRLHTRWGSFPVDSLGTPIAMHDDVVDGGSVRLAEGWHVREGDTQTGFFRWGRSGATLVVDPAAARANGVLEVVVSSNPFDPTSAIAFEVCEGDGILAAVRVRGTARIAVKLPASPAPEPRVVELRVAGAPPDPAGLPVFERRDGLHFRLQSARLGASQIADTERHDYPAGGWANAYPFSRVDVVAVNDGLQVATDPVDLSYAVEYGPLTAPRGGIHRFEVTCTVVDGGVSFGVLTGDRSRWLPVSLNRVDADGRSRFDLTFELAQGERFWIVATNDHRGAGVSRFVVHRLSGSDAPQSTMGEAQLRLAASARVGQQPLSSRIARAVERILAGQLWAGLRQRVVQTSPEYRGMEKALQTSDAKVRELAAESHLRDLDRFLHRQRPPFIHANGCGDFHLLARAHFDELRGYPEFETYSMNIDGLFAYIAAAFGIEEQAIDFPIYHLEHEIGSGWSPEGEARLRQRIAERGITWIDATTVHIWASYMGWMRRPMIFNGADWGLAAHELPERVVAPAYRSVS